MLLGCTIIILAFSGFFIYKPDAAWTMLFSWWRQSTSDDTPTQVSSNNTPLEKQVTEDEKEHKAQAVDDDGSSTPRAQPRQKVVTIPSFALDASADFSSDEEDNLPPPQFPALNSAQRASAPSKPSVPSFDFPVTPSLSIPAMAPPPRPNPSTALRPPPANGMRPPTLAPVRAGPSPANGLRVPASGPLPNRGPGKQSSSLSVQLTTSVTQPNPRKKIALSPGHSPLDWAHLQKTDPNLSGVHGYQRVTPSALKFHNGRKGRPAWASYQGRVYNISPYLPFHPGGEGELRRCAGKDGEKLFNEVHPWVNWDNMMEQCLVGILVIENDPRAQNIQSSPLEEMD